MPFIGKKDVSPDDAVKQGLCPECAIPLADLSLTAHAEEHWPAKTLAEHPSDEAIRRRELLINFQQPGGNS